MKHTPGPWMQKTLMVVDSKGATVCHCTRWDDRKPQPEIAEANARIITATPDLLDALRNIIEIGKRDLSNPKYDGYFEAARVALAKASE